LTPWLLVAEWLETKALPHLYDPIVHNVDYFCVRQTETLAPVSLLYDVVASLMTPRNAGSVRAWLIRIGRLFGLHAAPLRATIT
jgi:hypothetical protein